MITRLVKKAVAKGRRMWNTTIRACHDARHATYAPLSTSVQGLQYFFTGLSANELRPYLASILPLAEHYRRHEFDLLGSGWVRVQHGMICAGIEGVRYTATPAPDPERRLNAANRAESRRIRALIGSGYTPIDWHLDFKSGYRWREDTWYQHIRFGHLPGVDVKVPWELARSQHFVQLAFAYALSSDAQPYADEFRNQVLDFIASNPPRFGVNWACTMDVAIRIANWLVAYDLFCAAGASFDTAFVTELARSAYQHGEHVITNLEWNPRWRTNHYFANIAGLLFTAAYLPRSPRTDVWLAYAVQEFLTELTLQFHPDGSNFEGSTSYHRLSAEMAIYCAALICGLPNVRRAALTDFDNRWYTLPRPLAPIVLDPERFMILERVAEFTRDISKPSGNIPQFGDNDSGRFFKMEPVYTADIEDSLNHQHLIGAINGLLRRKDFLNTLDTSLVQKLAHDSVIETMSHDASAQVRIGDNWVTQQAQVLRLANRTRLTIPIKEGGTREELRCWGYPEFGLYGFRSRRMYLAIRCGSIGQMGNGGHDHNDQLAIELTIDGTDWIVDPGTYLYTPFPAWRNRYRSARAHFAPQPATPHEPASLDGGLFVLRNARPGKCLYFGPEGFIGSYPGYGVPLFRVITLHDDQLLIDDVADGPFAWRQFDEPRWPTELAISSQYGRKES